MLVGQEANMKEIIHQIAAQLSSLTQISEDEVLSLFEYPQDVEMGHVAFPCFKLAKQFKTSPQTLALKLKEQLDDQQLECVKMAQNVGPYINYFIKSESLSTSVLREILSGKKQFGFKELLQKPTAVVEFSSPNIAKPFSIGHLRSTNLGACIARIFESQGWNVVRINHLGDWGTQFGKLICAYLKWGREEGLRQNPIEYLFQLYVRFHEEEEKDDSLGQQAREWFKKLEQGDEKASKIWKQFKEITLDELTVLYQQLGVHFDHYWGESFYIEHLDEVFKELEKKKLSKKDNDAWIVDLKNEKLGVSVIQKGDESSLYITRDLAAAIYRARNISFDKMIYVVGMPQKLHFEQLFKILEKLGHDFVKKCEHVEFGHMSLGDQKMSTRKGHVVFLKDVIAQAKQEAMKIVQEKNPQLDNKDEVAFDVALAAIFFADVSARRTKDIKFDWKDILSFDGETGPYLQYTLVRINSLIEKLQLSTQLDESVMGLIQSTQEQSLLLTLHRFERELEKAFMEREPFILGQYLIDLAKAFNRFYSHHRLLSEAQDVAKARFYLVLATRNILEAGLTLLGIARPKKM